MSAREEFIDNETTAIIPIPELEREFGDPKQVALAIPAQARAIVVRDQGTLTEANMFLQDIKRLGRTIDKELDPGIEGANAQHKLLVAQKKKFKDPLLEAEALVKPKIADYLWEEDQKRLAAQRAAQLAKEQEARIAQDAADKAHALIDAGKINQSAKIVEKAVAKIEEVKAATPVIPDKAEAEGTQLRTIWDFEITDPDLIPRKYLVIDEVLIRKIVRAMKDQTDIPGVRAYPTRTVASRI